MFIFYYSHEYDNNAVRYRGSVTSFPARKEQNPASVRTIISLFCIDVFCTGKLEIFVIRSPSFESTKNTKKGWDAAQLVTASDRHAADAGSMPRYDKGFSSQSQLSVQRVRNPPPPPHVCKSHALTSSSDPCQSSVDYGGTNIPSTHHKRQK